MQMDKWKDLRKWPKWPKKEEMKSFASNFSLTSFSHFCKLLHILYIIMLQIQFYKNCSGAILEKSSSEDSIWN